MNAATLRKTYETELKKKFVINHLKAYGITAIDGKPLEILDYEHLKRQLAIARCRFVDITADSNVWF